jgi:hypothetical protein
MGLVNGLGLVAMLTRIYENYPMDSFLQWFTGNNKLIIQILVAVIGLVMVYLVYRLFFASHEVEETVGTADSLVKMPQPEVAAKTVETSEKSPEKLADTVVEAAAAPAPVVEVKVDESLKLENENNLKKISELENKLKSHLAQLSSKDEQLANMKEQLNAKRPVPAMTYVDPVQLSGDANLIAQIDELQKKLKEYDIISDDIAELQDLRKENTALKSQLEEKPAAT